MKTLHICNVNFEWELETHSSLGLKESFMVHPNFLQLQFLPFLYANEGDGMVVTHHPPQVPDHLTLHTYEETVEGYDRLETWGWSKAIQKWAPLPHPVPQHLRELASKTFAFTHSPNLPGAKLLHHEKEVKAWLQEGPYPKVVKTCFGLAGRGKWILEKPEDLPRAAFQEFAKGHFLIGEPWVNREMDFSTQWVLDEEITFLGATVLENTEEGHYNRTWIGKEIPHLDQHLETAQIPLRELFERGYRGSVGIDAFIYDQKLHPICEINLRKTMGWLALKLGRSLAYENGQEGPLPNFLDIGKKISFQKQLKLL
ncbi:MAG: ATP-grasp domain-containing protein [Chlamydiia bacterium]|nr:ATP-grasp domain-containing protein [Chlamydiia bacterium]